MLLLLLLLVRGRAAVLLLLLVVLGRQVPLPLVVVPVVLVVRGVPAISSRQSSTALVSDTLWSLLGQGNRVGL